MARLVPRCLSVCVFRFVRHQESISRLFCCFVFLFITSILGLCQNPPPSDPQALGLAQQSIAALTNGIAVSDMTLTGNATWIAGSDVETGPTTLKVKGAGESR